MLCIIYTGKRLIAGINTNIVEILAFEDYTFNPGEDLQTNLEVQLPAIIAAYKNKLTQSGLEIPLQIPLTFIFPVNFPAGEKQQLVHWLKSQVASLHLLCTDTIPLAYLKGLNDAAHFMDKNCIVLEALGNELNVVYQFVPNYGQKSQYFSLKDLGWQAGYKRVFEKLFISLAEEGYILDKEAELQLQQQVQLYKQKKHFHIRKVRNGLEIDAKIELSPTLIEELLTEGRFILGKILNPKKLAEFSIQKIILLGDYFDNDIFLNYICDKSNLSEEIYFADITDLQTVYLKIIKGAVRKAQQKQLAGKKAQLEAQLQIEKERNQFIQQIQVSCIESEQLEQYKLNLIPKGQQLGIPEEVIYWHITETIRKSNREKDMKALSDSKPRYSKPDNFFELAE